MKLADATRCIAALEIALDAQMSITNSFSTVLTLQVLRIVELEKEEEAAFIAGYKAGYRADEPMDVTAYKAWLQEKNDE